MPELTRRDGLLGLAALAGLGGCGAGPLPPIGVKKVPLDLTSPRPTAQLMLGATGPVTAIFDTGAAASVIRLALAERAGLREQGHVAASGPGGKPVPGFRTSITGQLGEAAFADAMAMALDLPLPWPNIEAIISPGVFSGRFVVFDFARSVAEVMDLTPANTPAGKAGGYSNSLNPFAMTSLPAMPVLFPGGARPVLHIDTGSARSLVLPKEMAADLPLTGPLQPSEDLRFVGVTRKASKGVIAGVVEIGGVTFENPEVTFGEGVKDGHVGMALLRQTRIVLDPRGRRIWLLPPA